MAVDPDLIITGAGGAVGGAWLFRLLVKRTLQQFDQAIIDVGHLKTEAAVQKVVTDKIVEPLRKEVAELRERVAKAEAANKKAQEADMALNKKINTLMGKSP